MAAKRKSAPTRAAVAVAGALLTATMADAAHAAAPPPTAWAQIKSDLETLNGALGAISNAYGTFQAAQFLLTYFGILGKDTSVADAVRQITAVLQQYRNDTLLGDVEGDMDEISQIATGDSSLWPIFIDHCDQHFHALQIAISGGNMTDGYVLGPDFNLLGMTCVGAVKARGAQDPSYVVDTNVVNEWLSELLQTDYSLVGGITVNMDVSCSVQAPFASPGSNVFQWIQGGKKMWLKYATQDGPSCDFNRGCNTISTELGCCQVFHTVGRTVEKVSPEVVRAALNAQRRAFLADPSVKSVRTGMLGAASALSPDQSVISDGSITWDIDRNAPFCQGHLGF